MQSFMTPPAEFASPDSVARRRKVAEAMMQGGIDTSPVGHPFQAIARVLQAGIGGYNMHRADKEDKAGNDAAFSKIASALGGQTPVDPAMFADERVMNSPMGPALAQEYMQRRKPKEKKWDTFTTKTGDVMRVDQNADTPDPQMVYDAPDNTGPAPEALAATTGLRKEIQDLPSYKSYSSAMPVFQSMAEAAKHDTKPGDLNMVYALAKLFDPTSVVREGEMIMVKNAQNLPDKLMALIQETNSGGRLGPQLRNEMMAEAQSRMQSYKATLDSNLEQFRGIAQRNQFNEADIMPTMGEMPQYEPLPVEQQQQQDSAQQQPPVEGAKQAPDGKWYVPDPNRPGKFLMVQP
jgi:hypothetical protein